MVVTSYMRGRTIIGNKIPTLKKPAVDPVATHPYLILVCLAKSSAELMGLSILSMVRKAARLAVYEEIIIRVKNHQKLATNLDDTAL